MHALPSSTAVVLRRTLLVLPLLLAACRAAERVEVHREPGRVVALDAANAIARRDDSWAVSLETRLDTAVTGEGRRWNREVTRILLRCDPLGERVIRTSRFLDDGPMLSDQPGDLRDTTWRAPATGRDSAVLRRACEELASR